jgi:hypothetical protein
MRRKTMTFDAEVVRGLGCYMTATLSSGAFRIQLNGYFMVRTGRLKQQATTYAFNNGFKISVSLT